MLVPPWLLVDSLFFHQLPIDYWFFISYFWPWYDFFWKWCFPSTHHIFIIIFIIFFSLWGAGRWLQLLYFQDECRCHRSRGRCDEWHFGSPGRLGTAWDGSGWIDGNRWLKQWIEPKSWPPPNPFFDGLLRFISWKILWKYGWYMMIYIYTWKNPIFRINIWNDD